MLVLFWLLQTQATRQIIFLGPNGQVQAVQADGQNRYGVGDQAYVSETPILIEGSQPLQLLGAPQWSPAGDYLAATVTQSDTIQVVLLPTQSPTPTLFSASSGVLALPSNGWAPAGTHLALIERNGDQSLLRLADMTGSEPRRINLKLDTRAGLSWHPSGRFLVVTGQTDDFRPALFWVETDGNVTFFEPADNQAMHADGAWSPDGEQIAYVAAPAYKEDYTTSVLGGDIWIADQEGARAIVTEGHNLAPTWSPRGDFIFFIRYLKDTQRFELYRVRPNGKGLRQVGPAARVFTHFPFDRRLFLNWSPDGRRLVFLGDDEQGQVIIYLANDHGTAAVPLSSQCGTTEPFAAHWSPISRTLLIGCPAGSIFFHALDQANPRTDLTTGLLPVWSPDASQVAFWEQGGALSTVKVDGSDRRPAGNHPDLFQPPLLIRGRPFLRLLGGPQWAPKADRFATTIAGGDKTLVALFNSPTAAPILIEPAFDLIALPTRGWSPNGSHLALIEHDGSRALLSLVNLIQFQSVALELVLETRAGFEWHPGGEALMATARPESAAPTLYLVDSSGRFAAFEPQDGQVMRADGAWRPDGAQVAYVAADRYEDNPAAVLAGSIWLANSDGTNPRPLVVEGLNLAPTWSPRGDWLYFTRYVSEEERFDLYRIAPDGQSLSRVESISAAIVRFPLDRDLFLSWSSNERNLFFQGPSATVFHASVDGTDVEASSVPCADGALFTTRWASTSRALLVACPAGNMFLRWVDQPREDTQLPDGLLPAWQP
ncbi:MAG: hypothetical protein AB1791_06610 [Chloroflexota bacterium]